MIKTQKRKVESEREGAHSKTREKKVRENRKMNKITSSHKNIKKTYEQNDQVIAAAAGREGEEMTQKFLHTLCVDKL